MFWSRISSQQKYNWTKHDLSWEKSIERNAVQLEVKHKTPRFCVKTPAVGSDEF